MYNDFLEIINTYQNVIIPALENGQINIDDNIIESFLELVNALYSITSYEASTDETELKNKLLQYYSDGNKSGIIGLIYSFILSAKTLITLQYNYQQTNIISQVRMEYIANFQRNISWKKNHTITLKERFKGKGVVYTAITGNYDTVHDPLITSPNLDYILFTNNPNLKSNVWKIIFVDNPDNLDNIRLARHIKIMGYEYLSDYDYSIWVDGKLQIIGDIEDYIKQNKDDMPILCMPHYIHNCAYAEESLCETEGKDNISTMRSQIARYKSEGYPENNGMIDSCVLIRELKDKQMNNVMATWWNEVKSYSYRDQLSFNYSFWKNDYIYDAANIYCYDNPYFTLHNHQ